MTKIKKYRIILGCCLCIFLFIVADTFLIPEKVVKERIENKKKIIRTSRKRASTFTCITSDKSYYLDEFFYNTLSIGDTLTVTKSIVSSATKNIARPHNGYANSYDTRLLVAGSGIIFIPFFTIATLLVLTFLPQLSKLEADKNAVYVLSIISTLYLLSYLFNF